MNSLAIPITTVERLLTYPPQGVGVNAEIRLTLGTFEEFDTLCELPHNAFDIASKMDIFDSRRHISVTFLSPDPPEVVLAYFAKFTEGGHYRVAERTQLPGQELELVVRDSKPPLGLRLQGDQNLLLTVGFHQNASPTSVHVTAHEEDTSLQHRLQRRLPEALPFPIFEVPAGSQVRRGGASSTGGTFRANHGLTTDASLTQTLATLADGIDGASFRIVGTEEGKRLGLLEWETSTGSPVRASGTVTLTRSSTSATEYDVSLRATVASPSRSPGFNSAPLS